MSTGDSGEPRKRRTAACGMTLVELMIAVVVLAIGMGAATIMISTVIANNSRNKRDTTSTLLAQTVMEQLLWAGASATTPMTITDCLGNNFTIDPTGGSTSAGRGAVVNATTGAIDFTAAPSPSSGYNMNYTVCRANNMTQIYDVRWNIRNLDASSATTYTKLITVAARPAEAAGGGSQSLQLFAIPVTLRSYAAIAAN